MSRRRLLWFSVLIILISILLGLGSSPHHMDGTYDGKVKITENRLYIIMNALENFREEVNQYPSTKEGLNALIYRPKGSKRWNGPYITAQEWLILKQINKDIWGTQYIYNYPAQYSDGPYDLYSCGKNKQDDLGTGDDISIWKAKDPAFYDKEDSGLHMDPLSQLRSFLLLLVIILLISAVFVKK